MASFVNSPYVSIVIAVLVVALVCIRQLRTSSVREERGLILYVLVFALGILQAVTQIQDQSLPVAVKLLVVIVVLIFAGPLLVQPLVRQSAILFDSFPTMTR